MAKPAGVRDACLYRRYWGKQAPSEHNDYMSPGQPDQALYRSDQGTAQS